MISGTENPIDDHHLLRIPVPYCSNEQEWPHKQFEFSYKWRKTDGGS